MPLVRQASSALQDARRHTLEHYFQSTLAMQGASCMPSSHYPRPLAHVRIKQETNAHGPRLELVPAPWRADTHAVNCCCNMIQ